jgi:hypothetical protein
LRRRTIAPVRLAAMVAAAAVLAPLASPDGARAGTCPDLTILEYGTVVYLGEPIPAAAGIDQAGPLGEGFVDEPTEADVCRRERTDVTVARLEGIDPQVAVGVEGRPQSIFVLGNKCVGFEGPRRWTCLREPLELEGRTYVATAYPPGPGPARELALGEPIAGATLSGAPADAVAIEGVDPSVAVGIADRPEEAYVALGACLYERFDRRRLFDDLRRCLEAPVWLVFDPPGARPGERITARADRPLERPEDFLVWLGPSTVAADILPDDLSGQVALGELRPGDHGASVSFEVPDLEPGRYETFVTCSGCEPTPSGSVLVVEGGGDSNIATIVTILIGVAFIGALGASFVVWRRGRAMRRAAGQDDGEP